MTPTPPPPARRLSRRRLLAAMPALGVLAACGSGEDTARTSPAGSATPSAPSTDAGYRVTVETADDGAVALTTEPRRVVAMNGGRVVPFLLPFLDGRDLLAYGGEATPETHPWVAEQLAGLPTFGIADGPPLEALASFRPDLVLANGNVGDYWEPARQVAPLLQLPETDWRATVRLLGDVFEDPRAAERTIDETERLVADAARESRVTAAVLSPYQDDGTVGMQVLGAELPNLMADLGVDVAGSATALDGYEDVSLEQLPARLDVDWVVVVHNGDDLQRALLDDPLLQTTEPFRAGRVVALDAVQSRAGFPVTPPSLPVVLDGLDAVLRA